MLQLEILDSFKTTSTFKVNSFYRCFDLIVKYYVFRYFKNKYFCSLLLLDGSMHLF